MTPLESANMDTQLKLYDDIEQSYRQLRYNESLLMRDFSELFYKRRISETTKNLPENKREYVFSHADFEKMHELLQAIVNPSSASSNFMSASNYKYNEIIKDRKHLIIMLQKG